MAETMTKPDKSFITALARQSTATVHEALGKKGALPSAIKPVARGMRLCGPAFTVDSPPANNLLIHEAIYQAQPGDVLVVRVGDHYEAGYWGEIMAVAAVARGLAGLVIDGCVRDSVEMTRMSFAAFSRGLCIRGTGKDRGGQLNKPLTIGDITVHPGDMVLGDDDGVVVVPQADFATIVEKSEKRVAVEDKIMARLKGGESTLDIYNF
jgi:4-hydroxy-4-methyl-2-oxoglutarate aldolase